MKKKPKQLKDDGASCACWGRKRCLYHRNKVYNNPIIKNLEKKEVNRKIGKVKIKEAGVTEDSKHRWFVQYRKMIENNIKNDISNINLIREVEDNKLYSFKGTHAQRKEEEKRYIKRVWQAFWVMLSLPILYLLAINLLNI